MLTTFSGLHPSQREGEFRDFLDILKQEGVGSYLEVGARHGDSFHAVMSSLPYGSIGVAVDLPGALWGSETSRPVLEAAADDLRAKGYRIHLIFGDSRARETVAAVDHLGPFDAVLIDGDHTLPGVMADWTNYGPMGRRLVAFHDIAGHGQAYHASIGDVGATGTPVEVPTLWAHLKARHPHTELIDPGSAMGIGVLWSRTT